LGRHLKRVVPPHITILLLYPGERKDTGGWTSIIQELPPPRSPSHSEGAE